MRKMLEAFRSSSIRSHPSFFSSWDFEEPVQLVQKGLESVLHVARAHAGSLFIWDETSKALVLVSSRGPYLSGLQNIRVPLRRGILGWVCEEGRSVLVKDRLFDERVRHIQRPGVYRTDSFMAIPLVVGNKLLGVVNITEKKNLGPFSEEDFSRSKMICRWIAVAYENLKLRLRVEEKNLKSEKKIHALEGELCSQEHYVNVGKLSANLAHELGNPLDAIRRYMNLALDQVPEDSLAREYLLKAKEGIRRSIHVIRGLLRYAVDGSRPVRKVRELHELIEEGLSLVFPDASANGVQIQKTFYLRPISVLDCGLIIVFRNLFRNAVQAMEGQGTLNVGVILHAQKAVVLIRDSGRGIPPEIQERLFEPFFSTKKTEGSGIGLSISRGIVEKCGGRITCRNHEAGGAEFRVELPFEKGDEKLINSAVSRVA
ncbi:MAG: GAF domain-containing sensor histidine kinase [Candidatus Omnitrophica bacterium]|nr:GAF domain-containing sensor histidine kinase [Candidatus Omnitrophota bacterium]